MEAPYAAGRPVSWWVTGAPRTDFLLAGDDELPADLRGQAAFVGELARRPPARAVASRPRGPAGLDDLPRLGDRRPATGWSAWLADRGAVLGVRPPVTGPVTSDPLSHPWRDRLVEAGALDLSAHRVPRCRGGAACRRPCWSPTTPSELADFPVTGRPVVCFAPDLDESSRVPGLLHDLADVVAGPLCRDVAGLRAALERALAAHR